MSSRLILAISFTLTTVLGGLLAGLGLQSTPIGSLLQNNLVVLAIVGTLLVLVAQLAITYAILTIFSELVLIPMGNERVNSLVYLLSTLLMGRAGDMKIIDKGEVIEIKKSGGLFSRDAGLVVINHGNAVVFERFGKISKVALKGLVQTLPFETIRTAVDLTLQHRQKEIALFTKDGFPLQTVVRVDFQIHPGGRKPTAADMYPVLEQAVLNAVYVVPDWKEYTIESAVALLRPVIASRSLYEIYDIREKARSKNNETTELRVIKEQLQNSLDQAAFAWGVKVQNLDIAIKPPKEIEDQALEFEKSQLEEELELEKARAETRRIKEFMSKTGGTIADYALLQFFEKIGEMGTMPASLDQLLIDALERATLRAAQRQQKQADQAPPPSTSA